MLQISMILIVSTIHLWSNNLTKVKDLREMNKVVTIKEMIETIKEKMNWSEAILAIELGVDSQNIIAWKRGRTPRSKNYKRLKEIYESLSIEENNGNELKNQKIRYTLSEISKVDETLRKAEKDQMICQRNLDLVNTKIAAWNKKRHELINKLEELRGK